MTTKTISFCHYGTNDEELDVVARATCPDHDPGCWEIEIESIDGPGGESVNEDTIGQYGCTWTEVESAAFEELDGELTEPESDYGE